VRDEIAKRDVGMMKLMKMQEERRGDRNTTSEKRDGSEEIEAVR
jgi:hypothetical protein